METEKEKIEKWFDYLSSETDYIPRSKRTEFKKPTKVDTLQDLIEFVEYIIQQGKSPFSRYDITDLVSITSILKKINRLIGLDSIKSSIVNHVVYYLQSLNDINDYLHMVIYGAPGTGKTELAKHIGQLFIHLGQLKKGTFTKVVRADLIAGYLGQTAIKTHKVFMENLGGVLFIDEAYSLANKEKDDSFSKECVDTLCELLSNYKNEIMVILAGYETDIRSGLFRINAGIESRFQWKYTIAPYSAKELLDMFLYKINKNGWGSDIDKKLLTSLFEKHYKTFVHFGRDMDHLFTHVKIQHSRRVFINNEEVKKHLVMSDIEKGVSSLVDHKGDKNADTDTREQFSMYI